MKQDRERPSRGKKRPSSCSNNESPKSPRPPAVATRRPPNATTRSSPKTQKHSRPAPPPPPPQALVKLLQSDPTVLSYFKSLQANLDADLQIWKERSKQYQTQCELLEKQLDKSKKQTVKKKKKSLIQQCDQEHENGTLPEELERDGRVQPSNTAQLHDDDNNDDDDEEDHERLESIQPPPPEIVGQESLASKAPFHAANTHNRSTLAPSSMEARPLDDSMFLLLSSDDDVDDDDEGDAGQPVNTVPPLQQQKKPQHISFPSSSDHDDDSEDDDNDDQEMLDLRSHLRRGRTLPRNKLAATTPLDAFEEEEEDNDNDSAGEDMATLLKVRDHIRKAKLCLDRLGISLVETNSSQHLQQQQSAAGHGERQQEEQDLHLNVPTMGASSAPAHLNTDNANESTLLQQQDPTRITNIPTISYTRRSDQQVLSDLCQAIRTLSRLSVTFPDVAAATDECSPFAKQSMILLSVGQDADETSDKSFQVTTPTHQKPLHPIWQGQRYACGALLLMDAYCDVKSDDEWSNIWSPVLRQDEAGGSDSSDDDKLAVGMRDRKGLVELLLSSLHGEITQAWAVTDRTDRRLPSELLQVVEQESEQEETEAMEQEQQQQDGQDKQVANVESKASLSQKSRTKRAAVLERCFLARLAITLHLGRGDPTMAFRLIAEYVLSTSPSLATEEYPEHVPVLSLCVLEAMFSSEFETAEQRDHYDEDEERSWFSSFLARDVTRISLLGEALSLVIHATAFIWNKRALVCAAADSDSKITAVANVEVACYHRLLNCEKAWLGTLGGKATMADFDEAAEQLGNKIVDLIQKLTNEINDHHVMALALVLVLHGKTDYIFAKVRDAIGPSGKGWQCVSCILLASAAATRQVNVRNLDWLQQQVGRPDPVPGISDQRISREIAEWYTAAKQHSSSHHRLVLALQCCSVLADGESTLKIMSEYVHGGFFQSSGERKIIDITRISQLGEMPTVRVINLQRRCDRLDAFVGQAQLHNVRVVKAVVPLHGNQETSRGALDSFYGGFAFDGHGRKVHVEKQLSELVRPKHLDDLVEPNWLPSDLKAFDLNARCDATIVNLSPSERACALSHIASWKGVKQSLYLGTMDQGNHVLRLFSTSGFACGPSLLHSNQSMPPAPVCLVLEDDAVMVDRFVDRLQSILDELPRDFHFCSLGYGRPKTAPMVRFSTNVGIPTCLWYLTGYILSKDGADYLLNNLPVRGPVDSWVGFHMIHANWDNVFGQALGIGVHSKPVVEPPSRKDLAKILKFRAFAAVVPLCSQKVASASLSRATTSQRRWRQRDTDVTFSGS